MIVNEDNRMNLQNVPTPSYVIDEAKLIQNLEVLASVEKEAGCKILLAQKAFSNFCEYPLIGKYIEAERLYVSSLVVNHLHPYTEWGYGVTTRAITLGFFAAFKNTKFNGIGCRFGFELFRDW